ncbi:MAG: YdeI/OmpD-associated family protein, partial [Pseudomonadota bacterium]|nr:YdeI/OmpD-associated family protein [Pseudomonadota bacterium]
MILRHPHSSASAQWCRQLPLTRACRKVSAQAAIEVYSGDARCPTEAGIKTEGARKFAPKPPVEVPDDLPAALKKNAKARKTFDGFSPSARREYVQWLTEAKREETRRKRLTQAVEWMAEGKQRNWKYQGC